MTAERYLVQGGLPTIFPNTLKGLEAALLDAQTQSEDGKQIRLWRVHSTPMGKPFKDLIRVFEYSVCIFEPNGNETG